MVQGVGFRPHIYRLAVACGLRGFVRNTSQGVIAEVEGSTEQLDRFAAGLKNWPPQADVVQQHAAEIHPLNSEKFEIILSKGGQKRLVHITPDIATCGSCLKELFDANDRRYGYPFINCTDCGPRLTIINDIPYDRPNTSMQSFELCEECRSEYEDPTNRRFHAEPNACPSCGPQLSLMDAEGKRLDDPLGRTIEAIQDGKIIAIKGLGGFHLCVDARNAAAISRLRERKHREAKPLAIMVRDLEAAAELARISPAEATLLSSPQRPIVLLERLDETLPGELTPDMSRIGIMLPYTPLHHLLLAQTGPLVMTSANLSDEPICIDNDEAMQRLRDIADLFLIHDREIVVRCDDSVAYLAADQPRLMRRSRGYAPKPIQLDQAYPDILALGPQLKNTICVLKGSEAFLSPHIGDLESPQARDFLHETIQTMQAITACKPEIIACDLHPDYYSTMIAQNPVQIQHHHAHIVSCMAEHKLDGPVIGIALDGTGYGTDGKIWGGEVLICERASFKRSGHLNYFALPGGEAAIREPWRIAASLLYQTYGQLEPDQQMIETMLKRGLNSPMTSSLGRLFDGVAALLGIRQQVMYEGQAAMQLEAIAVETGLTLPYAVQDGTIDTRPMIRAIVESFNSGRTAAEIAGAFHNTICAAFGELANQARRASGLNQVVLSGGCFQNRLLLSGLTKELQGFEVFSHQLVPTNDGGISLGQAVAAGAIIRRNNEL